MPYDVSVVIVTYNSADVIEGLLETLPAALGDLRADVVIVDNGSQDSTVAVLERRRDCRLVTQSNRGYAAGLNAGIAAAAGTGPVLLLNPDTRLAAGSVAPLLEQARRPSVGVVAPRVVDSDGSLSFSLRREPSLLRAIGLSATRLPLLAEYLNRPADYDSGRYVDWALGAALLVSRQCLVAVGPWDESYFLYSEETDYCARARERGLRTWYEPRSVVSHIGGASGRSGQTHAMQIINRVRYYARRHDPVKAWLYFAVTVLSELSWIARGSSPARASVRALLIPSSRPAQLGLGRSLLPK